MTKNASPVPIKVRARARLLRAAIRVECVRSPLIRHRRERRILPPSSGNAGKELSNAMNAFANASAPDAIAQGVAAGRPARVKKITPAASESPKLRKSPLTAIRRSDLGSSGSAARIAAPPRR
jgi:hypothetical protein